MSTGNLAGYPPGKDANFGAVAELLPNTCGVATGWVYFAAPPRCWFGGKSDVLSSAVAMRLAESHARLTDGSDDFFPAALHPSVADVVTPPLGFFAGLPLRKGNRRVGAICIADVRPRRLNNRRRRGLLLLRQLAETHLASQTHNDDLQCLHSELQHVNEQLSVFVHAASHDLRAPLRTIMLLADAVHGRVAQDGKAADFVANIQDAARRGRTLVDDLLAHTRVDARQSTSSVDLQTCFQAACAELAESIRRTQATVTTDALPIVQGSPTAWALVFRHLIDNAIKYTPTGKRPTIHVASFFSALEPKAGDHPRHAPPASEALFCLAFSDNGCGVGAENLARVFEPLVRLHPSEVPGSGMGLATVNKLIGQMGGRIFASSVEGQGSVFTIEIPTSRAFGR